MIVKLLTEHHLEFLSLIGGCRGSSRVYIYQNATLLEILCTGSINISGLRPEQLPAFDDESWNLMSECWESEPVRRPLLGEVQQRLSHIFERYKSSPGPLKTAKDGPSKIGKPLKYKIK